MGISSRGHPLLPSLVKLYSTTTAKPDITHDQEISSVDSQSEKEELPEKRIPKKFVPYPFEYHQELTIEIDTLTNLGMGIARVNLADFLPLSEEDHDDDNINDTTTITGDDHDDNNDNNNNNNNNENNNNKQWVIMVPNVIPGETVVARIVRNHKQYSEADLLQVVHASPDRIQPRCPLAADCGGCQYQHMPIALQREWKTKHVQECFRQHKVQGDNGAPVIHVQPTMGTDQVFHYRSKITPHYQAPSGMSRKRKRKQKVDNNDKPPPTVQAIGFQQSSIRSIIDVPSCPIATQPLNDKYQQLRQELLHQPYRSALGATLLLRQANLHNDTVVSDHNEYMTTHVNGIAFTYQAGNFFQNNLYILPKMVDVVMEHASPPAANSGNTMTHFVDCYCGSGLFCLSAAKHGDFDTCVGIEINAKAIAEAQQNAIDNQLEHKCSFEAARAQAIFDNPHVQTFPRDSTVVMLDPPRKGCDEQFLEQLEAFRPQRIVYLSCNPATQARDVKEMVSWGYDITFIQPFDLFPQTRHIESLTVLERR